MRPPRVSVGLLITATILATAFPSDLRSAEPAARWWKGNLHTHTFWSDGDDFPEMVAEWYRVHGYQFLALSDHNTVQDTNQWVDINSPLRQLAYDKYEKRFKDAVDSGVLSGVRRVRLKTFPELKKQFDDSGRFLLVQSEEVSDRWKTAPVHLNATNLRQIIKPQGGSNIVETIQNNVNAVLEQRNRLGVPMFVHLNHPNFGFAITAEEMMQVRGGKFFEVYNGHNRVFNFGHTNGAPGMDRFWDIILTWRLAVLGLDVLYGVGTDDSHSYHDIAFYKAQDAAKKAAAAKSGDAKSSTPAPAADAAAARDPAHDLVTKTYSGRGWVMVRAARLTEPDIVLAMEAGEFYASNGVTLRDVRREKGRYSVEIEPEPGVTYTTQFIGTRRGFDRTNTPLRNKAGAMLRMTHTYSKDVGAVLAEVKGASASYTLKGDEIYVRAKVTSSKPKANPSELKEVEQAWTQPLVTGVK